jgi:hypothetical protein
MLFELALVVAEQQAERARLNWKDCLTLACARQREFYDAELPNDVGPVEKEISCIVADNLAATLSAISFRQKLSVVARPRIPGYQWISNGVGDFATASSIIEIKCTNKRFSTADYRQVLIYWLLSYIDSLERDTSAWSKGLLINPRSNFNVEFDFADLLTAIAPRRSPVDIAETFRAIVDRPAEST